MRDYAILVRDRHPDRAPDIAVVPYGFSWGAFFFQALWALYRGVWLTAIVLLVASLTLSVTAGLLQLDPVVGAAMEIGGALILALAAFDLSRFELVRRGFALNRIISARSLAEAEVRGIHALVAQAGEQSRHVGGVMELSHSQGLQPSANRSI